MKKIFFLFSILFVFNGFLQAQGWTELGINNHALNPNNSVWTICSDTGGVIYAAGGFTDGLTDTSGKCYVAKWDGNSWSQIGIGINALHANGGIDAICVDAAHNIYAAGAFTNTDGKYYVAKWNGTTWSEIGAGVNALNANGPINSICIDALGNVYAAGMFTDSLSDTSGHAYVAKWDGTTWSELGTYSHALNPNGGIRSIIADSAGGIYAAGDFRYIPGGYYYVAKWNGISWSQLGVGANALNADGAIWTLYIDAADNVYAGGFFENISSKYYVAKWNGTSWSEMGLGVNALNANSEIFSITGDMSGNIYAAGIFENINGKHYVAKWNGISWNEVGGLNILNANGSILTICTDKTGSIYASGNFTDSLNNLNGHPYVANFNAIKSGVTLIKEDNIVICYPNPCNDIFHLIGNKNISDFVLYDALGNVVLSGKLLEKNTSIDVSKFLPGNYFLQVNNNIYKVIKI